MSAQRILSTGSLSGLHTRPLFNTLSSNTTSSSSDNYGSDYLSSSKEKHPFCSNSEGWGPLSPFRYDFTPCFMDVWVGSVAVYGILFGAVAIWWLVRRKQRVDVPRDWHFWSKLVGGASFRPYFWGGTGGELGVRKRLSEIVEVERTGC
ncbi:hypothetical protein WAI453_001534 [Rhynchosporium graminicola]